MAQVTKATDAATGEVFMTLLKRHRMARGFTQSSLAKKLKVVPSTVCGWESGESLPNPKLIPELARMLGIDPMSLTRVISPDSDPVATSR